MDYIGKLFSLAMTFTDTNSDRGGSASKLQYFLVISTCVLYLVAAGLFSKAVWYFEAQMWNNAVGRDAAELGNGPGSYDITKSVWHVNVSLSIVSSKEAHLQKDSLEIQN
jgi:high-affinity Fe2+/Pb2+ permease